MFAVSNPTLKLTVSTPAWECFGRPTSKDFKRLSVKFRFNPRQDAIGAGNAALQPLPVPINRTLEFGVPEIARGVTFTICATSYCRNGFKFC